MSHPARPTVIAVNQTGSDITIADLGVVVPASGSLTLNNSCYLHEIQASIDLYTAITAGDILIGDGVGTLNLAQSQNYVTGVASAQNLQAGVTGPASSIANQVPKFSGTDGKTLVASPVTINASDELDMDSARIVNLAMPTGPSDAASKGYVDGLVNGLDPKASVRAASVANVVSLSGPQTVDGVSLIAGERVLLKEQISPVENGIWVVAAGAWARASDMAVGSSAAGNFCYAEEGTLADQGFICTNNVGSDVVGTSGLAFAQFGSFQLATVAPEDVTKSSAVTGVSSRAAREDHKHDVTTAAPAAASLGAASADGSATTLARSDHVHQSNTAPVNVTKAAAAIGTSGEPARADHKHDVTTAAPATGIGAGNTEGSATTLARSDHNHAIRESGGQDLTMAAVADGQMLVRSGTTITGQTAATAVSLTHKNAVRAATTAAGTLATSFANAQTIDGVTLATGDRILIKNQASAIENGLYTVNASGAPTRAVDLPAAAAAGGVSVYVQEGTVNADTGWLCTTNNPSAVVGTNNLVFQKRDFPLTSSAPVAVTKAAAVIGTSEEAARADHKHDVTTAAPGATGVATASGEGASTSLARADHTHQSNTAPVNVTKAAAAIGTSGQPARADHKHDITTAAPGATGVATAAAEGASTSLARADHVHQSNTAPVNVTKAAAAIGTSGQPARADHKHDITTAAPAAASLGTAAAEGSATSLARSDHVHQANTAPVAVTKAAAVIGTSTEPARADHKHDVTTAAPAAAGLGTTAAEGAATSLARSDHVHQANTAPVNVTKAAAAIGTSTEPARADHKHDITTAAPTTGIGAGNTEGSASTLARSDHDHVLRESGGQALTLGAVADGQFLQRSGTTIIGASGGGGGGNDAWKQPCRIVTTVNDTLSGLAARDGVTPVAGDRVLVVRQDDLFDNGIYVADAGAWTRAADADSSGDVLAGTTVVVNEGTVYADTQWTLATNDPIVLGTTDLVWRKLGFPEPEVGPTDYTAAYDPNDPAGVVIGGVADIDDLLDLQGSFDLDAIGLTAPLLVAGSELRNVMSFSGGTNEASFERTASLVGLLPGSAYTFIAEFRIDSHPVLDEGNLNPDDGNGLLYIGGSSACGTMQVRYNNAGYSEFGGGGFGPSFTDGRSWTPIALGQWYLGAITWDGTTLQVKLDDDAPVVTTPSLIGIGTLSTYRIGRSSSTVSTFNGQMGRVRVYGYALSPAELSRVYNELRGAGTGAPADVDNSAGNPGVSNTAARSDHKHAVNFAAPTVGIGGGNAAGVSAALALADHNHALREGMGTDLTIGPVSDGQFVRRVGTNLSGATLRKHVTLAIGSANIVVTGGKAATLVRVPFDGIIVGWSLVADTPSTVTLDVWKAAGAVPTNADSITASDKPSLTAAEVGASSTLTDWTTLVAIGDVLMLEVEANDNASQLTLVLEIEIA